ncbi:MAG: hypothetical protein AAGF90_07915, partial [Pseudomonadota bacterium]
PEVFYILGLFMGLAVIGAWRYFEQIAGLRECHAAACELVGGAPEIEVKIGDGMIEIRSAISRSSYPFSSVRDLRFSDLYFDTIIDFVDGRSLFIPIDVMPASRRKILKEMLGKQT